MKTLSYQKNEIIFNEGDRCEYVCFVKKGNVKIATFSAFGNEIIYNQVKEGNFFGDHLIFSEHPLYLGHILCEKNSEIIFYTKEEFISIFFNDRKKLENYLADLSRNEIRKNETIKMLSLKDIKERFFYYLSIHDNKISFLSVTSLAEKLSITRESCSRMLSKLEKEKRIRIDRENKIIMKNIGKDG